MLKSHVEAMLRVFEALFKDIKYALPQLGDSLSKDMELIRRTALTRGVTTLVVDLPSIGKHFDRCLAKKLWSPARLPMMGCSSGSVIPRFLGGLLQEIFGNDGRLKNNYNIEAVIFFRQVCYLCKKVPLSFSETALRTAVQKMVEEDALLPEPEEFWFREESSSCLRRVCFTGFLQSSYVADRAKGLDESLVSVVLRNLDKVSRALCRALGVYDPLEWRCKHGPGAISQVAGPSNKYHWYGWSQRLESVYPVADYGFHSLSSWAGSTFAFGMHDNYVPTSRLVAVPKTYETPRLIAAEPAEHQWCQQNLWHYFRVRSSLCWINDFVRFTDQSLNQQLCWLGSTDGTLSTLDLSSASDRVSCHVVGNFFRSSPELLEGLRATRTHFMGQRLDQSLPSRIELRKFSTMGSACTFPVETLIFLGISLASVLSVRELGGFYLGLEKDLGRKLTFLEKIEQLRGSVAVFGDDIIVPTDCRELVQSTLELLDFRVNHGKSFSEGNFRESCGLDAFNGVDVTPIYLRHLTPENPGSTVSLVDTANHFYDYFYLRVAEHIESILPSSLMTVSVDSGVLGLHSRVGTRFPRKRWNTNLQREEVRGLALSSTITSVQQEDDSSLHQYFTEDPSPFESWEAGLRKSPQLKLKLGWVDISECV